MSWFAFPRVPEPEAMNDGGEVEAYSSAAAQACLGEIDDSLIAHAMRLLGNRASLASSRQALDIGTGPGQIVGKLAKRLPSWKIVGVDLSPNMIRQARTNYERAGHVEFLLADGTQMPFADGSFDLVLCNSVLHHVANPSRLLSEIVRVAAPTGAILLRDLRRPSRLAYPWHVRWYGRRYEGLMYRLYCASVRAAYRPAELSAMLRESPAPGAQVFTHERTHLGIERTARRGG